MRRILWVIFLLMPLMAFAAPVPVISVPLIANPIALEEDFAGQEWRLADSTSIHLCGTSADPIQQTLVRFLWDTTNLYLGVAAGDTDVWSTITKRDSSVWNEEAMEFFFDPDGDGRNYFEIDINALGTVADILMSAPWGQAGATGDFAWTATGMQHHITINGTINNPADTDQGWILKAAFPWSLFASQSTIPLPPRPGDTLRANVYRIDGRSSAKEMSCLSPTETTAGAFFHTPARFAKLFFKGPSTSAHPPQRSSLTKPVMISIKESHLVINSRSSCQGMLRVSISDLLGRILADASFTSDNPVIDLSAADASRSGMCLVRIFSGDRLIAAVPFIIPHQ